MGNPPFLELSHPIFEPSVNFTVKDAVRLRALTTWPSYVDKDPASYPKLDRLHWAAYSHVTGDVAFSRFDTEELGDIQSDAMRLVRSFFSEDGKAKAEALSHKGSSLWEPHQIHLLATRGHVPFHRDGHIRQCALNIGLFNPESARTSFIVDSNLPENLSKNRDTYAQMPESSYVTQDLQMKKGSAVLLNTSCLHNVRALDFKPRFLLSMSFAIPFEEVASWLRQS